ncbi:hypothetical protein GUITHDRAFT_46905, partial [Guillardia theta CCMP2712]
MCWDEDHLQIFFSHSKTGQTTGGRPGDPRRVYANPTCPEICPILALGIYLLCYLPDRTILFPGRSQSKRFLQIFSKILSPPEDRQRARSIGNDFGSASFSKGAAEYCSVGSTHGP